MNYRSVQTRPKPRCDWHEQINIRPLAHRRRRRRRRSSQRKPGKLSKIPAEAPATKRRRPSLVYLWQRIFSAAAAAPLLLTLNETLKLRSLSFGISFERWWDGSCRHPSVYPPTPSPPPPLSPPPPPALAPVWLLCVCLMRGARLRSGGASIGVKYGAGGW